MKFKKKKITIGVICLLVALSVSIFGVLYIKNQMYQATSEAKKMAKNGVEETNTLVFKAKNSQHNPAVIFYPGAFVEKESYSIWATDLAAHGYDVYLIQMPINLAIFGSNRAEEVIEKNKLNSVVIGGHSLGGVMASRFAREHTEVVKGVFFLASYPDEKGSLKDFNGAALSIMGTRDGVLNQKAFDKAKSYLPSNTTFSPIEGGNHAGFGSYGAQKGDSSATISTQEQQKQVADYLRHWLQEIH